MPLIQRITGERGWTRTIDPCLKRALLCQLSYAPAFSIHAPTTVIAVAQSTERFSLLIVRASSSPVQQQTYLVRDYFVGNQFPLTRACALCL
jgi:hypothetical protein